MTFLKTHSSTQARIVRRNKTPCLLVSFATSNPQLIWQLDLEKLSSHTISLNEKDGEWNLGLVLPGGVFTPVAHFDERQSAEEAYAAISAVLIRDASRNGRGSWLRRTLWLILAALVVFFVVDIFSPSLPLPAAKQGAEQAGAYRQEQPSYEAGKPIAPPEKQEIQTGVPMNADDVLETPAP